MKTHAHRDGGGSCLGQDEPASPASSKVAFGSSPAAYPRRDERQESARNSAFKATGASRFLTGSYEVDFAHDVTACAYEATVGNAAAGNPAHASIVVAARVGNTKGVFVETKDSAGNLADAPFHLVVAC